MMVMRPIFAAAFGAMLAACGDAPVALPSAPTVAPDRAREARWAAEIVPALVVGEAHDLQTADGERFLALLAEPPAATGAVILVHGLGVHPDWGLIGALRERLSDAGFTTLSVQMPVLAADAPRESYAGLFPDAVSRIDAAVRELQRRGYAHIVIVSHSLGAAMSNAYLVSPGAARVDAWVAIGMSIRLDATPREPVLDVMGDADLPEVLRTATGRRLLLPHDACSTQIVIAGAGHFFEARTDELAARIAPFVARAFAGC